MGSVQSDGEDEFRIGNSTRKRFKLPKKFFDDCNSVDHASVPRKLRSAIKKRGRESVSPPFPESRKLNHTVIGVELLRKDRMKKSKLKQPEESEGSPGQATIGSISKDEEEVVETLYALAGMFSDTENTHKIDSDGEPSKAKSLALPEVENFLPVFKVPEVKKNSKITYPTTEAAPQSSKVEDSTGETAEIQNSNQGRELELHSSKQVPMELQSCIPKSNYPSISLFSKSTPASERQSSNSAALDCSERSWGAGLNQPLHDLNMDSDKNKEIAVGSVAAFRSHHELQHTINENKNYGSVLWPGLSSTGLHNTEMQGPSVNFSAAKFPSWLHNSTSTARPCSAGNAVLAEKESGPPIDTKKSWKKCSAHVYISRLIKVLQITEGKDRWPSHPTQLTAYEGLKQGAPEANKLEVVIKSGSTGVVSTIGPACSADTSLNEVNNAILLHKRLLEDQQQASTTSGPYVSQKQSFNFLSLPSGGCGVEANSVADRPGNGPGLEPSTQYHVPYLHSFPQNHTAMPVSLPQNHHVSTYLDHHSASGASQKAQIQLPPYLSNSVSAAFPPSLATVFPKQQQQQQQQWFWAAQLAAPHKPGEFAAAHITSWQNGSQESPCIMQYGHQLEVLGPRYIPVSLQQQQQQQFISNTSLSSPQSRVQRNHHRNGGVFCPGGASSLQLLCNEHL